MKSLNQITNEPLSVCDGCSNWHICKFIEDVKRAEAEYKQLRENANWPECVETTLGCKYKQYVVNRLSKYNDVDYTMTGYNTILNSDYTSTGSSKTT